MLTRRPVLLARALHEHPQPMPVPNLICPDAGLRVTFVGTGEALDPDLPNTSLLVQGQRTLLLDCGYAVPHALWSLTRDPDLLDGVYLSHLHADHAFGLPALLLWMRLSGRTRPLQIFGAGTTAAGALKIAERGYPGSFEAGKCYSLEVVALTEGTPHVWGDMQLDVAASDHARMLAELRQEVGRLVVATTGKVIGKTLSDEDQKRLIDETNAELAG